MGSGSTFEGSAGVHAPVISHMEGIGGNQRLARQTRSSTAGRDVKRQGRGKGYRFGNVSHRMKCPIPGESQHVWLSIKIFLLI